MRGDVLARGDILHLGRDDAGARVGELRRTLAGLRTQDLPAGAVEDGELLGLASLEAVVLGPRFAARDFLDVAARDDPGAAQLGQALRDVDLGAFVRVGARGVVDADRWLVQFLRERDLAHRDCEPVADLNVGLARAGNGARGDLWGELAVVDVHLRLPVGTLVARVAKYPK